MRRHATGRVELACTGSDREAHVQVANGPRVGYRIAPLRQVVAGEQGQKDGEGRVSKVVFRVIVVERDDGTFIAVGESDGHRFDYIGTSDVVYHEVENQLDSATTKEVTQ
jgi:hypothetical protein